MTNNTRLILRIRSEAFHGIQCRQSLFQGRSVSAVGPAVAQPGRASESGEQPHGDAVDLRPRRGPLSLSGGQRKPETPMRAGMSPVQIRPAGPNLRLRPVPPPQKTAVESSQESCALPSTLLHGHVSIPRAQATNSENER